MVCGSLATGGEAYHSIVSAPVDQGTPGVISRSASALSRLTFSSQSPSLSPFRSYSSRVNSPSTSGISRVNSPSFSKIQHRYIWLCILLIDLNCLHTSFVSVL
jgi:hypothetical protein